MRLYQLHIIILSLLAIVNDSAAYTGGEKSRIIENTAFQKGEQLVFRAAYNSRLTGNIYAGEATLEIQTGNLTIDGRSIMHIVGSAKTTGLFNMFFRVENRYDSYLDELSISPHRFTRNIREGRYRRNDDVTFDYKQNLAYSKRDTTTIPPYVQDIISAFYYARTFSMDSVEVGDAFYVDFHLSDSVYVTRIVFEGFEKVTTRLGTFNTMKFKPQVQEGTVFNQPYPMTLWISDDDNKIPILVESGLVVGSVRLELAQFRGLKNTISSFVPN